MYSGSVAALDLVGQHVRSPGHQAKQEREHAQRRLDHLRAQVNPHFLFSTLNTLYTLAVSRAPALPEMILQHAGLLRYALDQTRHAQVLLAREVELILAYWSSPAETDTQKSPVGIPGRKVSI
jgi:LytS/YehU family sensor histidine kinase